jgi:superfamily II DNA or RNA helicase
MVTITIDNSYSRIEGLSVSQEKELKGLISYTVGGSAAFYSGFGIRKKSLIDKKGYFPTGLLYRVKDYLNKELIPVHKVDKRVKPKLSAPIDLNKTIKPYEDQLIALNRAITNHQGIITMPTGSGKSLVIALIAARFNLKTLVVVPSVEIKLQLTRSLLEALGSKHKVIVENIDSNALNTLKGIDCLIIDEAHHSAAKTYRNLNKTAWTGIYYRFFLTATPFRNDTEETLLFESIAGKVIYQLSYVQAVIKSYIVPIEAYYIEVPKQKTDAYTWAEVYKELVVNNKVRNTAIINLLTSLHGSGRSTLCLVKEVAHGQLLADITGLPYVNGTDEDSRKYIKRFNSGSLKVLIATTGIMGEGIDSKPAEYVIICGLGKAKSAFMQQVGRVLRTYQGKTSGKVIILKDKSHKFCSRHFAAQSVILSEEYGVKPIKLDI